MHTSHPSTPISSGAPASDPAACRSRQPARFLTIAVISLLLISPIAQAADKGASVRLTGIAQIDAHTVAFLEYDGKRGATERIILSAGQSTEGIELIAIDPKTGAVKIGLGGNALEVAMGSPVTTDQAPTLHFKNADARAVLVFYQELIGRTLLVSPSIPTAKITLKTDPAINRQASLAALETALRESGIIITLRDEKFAFATPISHVPRLAQIPAPHPVAAEDNEKFPPGLLKFSDADTSAIFDIYQELNGRTLLVNPMLPPAKITFKTQNELSRTEAVWLIESSLFLHGIQLVQEGTKFAFALPAIRNAAAPKIPGHPLAETLKASTKTFPAGTFKLMQASAQQVVPLYAELIERQPLLDPSTRTPAGRFTLRTQTALTLVEAIYAFDALAALHNARFELVGDKQVKLVHASDAGKSAGTN